MKHGLKISHYLLVFTILILFSCQKEDSTSINEIQGNSASFLSKNLSQYELIDIDHTEILGTVKDNISLGDFSFTIQSETLGELEFDLYDDHFEDLIGEEFKLYEVKENDERIERDLPEMYALAGNISESPNDRANFLVNTTYFIGQFYIDGELYVLEPHNYFDRSADSDKYLIYNSADQIIWSSAGECDYPEGDDEDLRLDISDEEASNQMGWCRVAEITWMLDYKFYQDFLYAYYDPWNAAVIWSFDNMWGANLLYYSTNQYPLFLQTKAGYIYTFQNSVPDPNTDNKETYKDQMKWFNNSSWFTKGDVFYMWTGSDLRDVGFWGWGANNVYGSAESRNVCSSQYNSVCFGEYVSGFTFQNRLMAHELGHVLGCNGHDNNSTNFMHQNFNNWNSSLGSTAISRFNSHFLNDSGCLHWTQCN